MVEGSVQKPDKTEFKECWKMTRKNPYILRLALSAGIGGFLFGYDTANISGALLYIREDFEFVNKNTWVQETIVSTTVAGAIVGAACGGYLNDRFGRKMSILLADIVFFFGAIVMAFAPIPAIIIVGRVLVGLGVGIASVTSPLYISETSHSRIRGALVSTNGLLLTSGQFLSYLVNLALTKAPGTWRWMLGVASVPALLQILLMLSLPESPRWLYRQNKGEDARKILEKIYLADEVDKEMEALALSIEAEKEDEASIGEDMISKLRGAFKNTVVRRGLYAGITVQVAQQFVGINTIMYYAPTIVQFAGFASKSMALSLSLITSGLNAVGTLISMGFVDRHGRRKLMIVSMIGIIVFLVATSVVFMEASNHAPKISQLQSLHFGANSTCSRFEMAPDKSKWNCMSCLHVECGFCSDSASIYHPGACLDKTKALRSACAEEDRVFFEQGCPSRLGFLAVILLALYIIFYAFGMGTVPWIVNSEIYPLRYRGIGGGIAAVSNWVSNLIVSESYLTLTEHIGAGGTFLLFAAVSCVSLAFIYRLVPETRGLRFEEVEKMLEKGYNPCSGGSETNEKGEKDVDSA